MTNRVEKLRQEAIELNEQRYKKEGNWDSGYERSAASKLFDEVWRLKNAYAVRWKFRCGSREDAEAFVESIINNPAYFTTRKTIRTVEYGWGESKRLVYFVTVHGFVKNAETWEED